jgi:hypothetical protein
MGGWMGGCKSRFKDCLQQSKICERKKMPGANNILKPKSPCKDSKSGGGEEGVLSSKTWRLRCDFSFKIYRIKKL